jgi:two-component system chemotaxis sensor kinase CheA
MARLAHRMEDLLDALRRGRAKAGSEVIDALLASVDALKGMAAEAVGRGSCAADVSSLVSRLERLSRGESAVEERAASSPRKFQVEVKLAEDCAMRAARAYVVLRVLEEFGTVLESRPVMSEVEGESFDGLEIEAVIASAEDPGVIEHALAATPEVESVAVRLLPEEGAAMRLEAGAALDPAALSARLAGEGAGRVVLGLTDLRELGPAGLDWLLSLKEARPVEIVLPALPAGRRFFELLMEGGFVLGR